MLFILHFNFQIVNIYFVVLLVQSGRSFEFHVIMPVKKNSKSL
jgi:hypothetical protein